MKQKKCSGNITYVDKPVHLKYIEVSVIAIFTIAAAIFSILSHLDSYDEENKKNLGIASGIFWATSGIALLVFI